MAAESDNVAKLLGTLTVEGGAAKGERWLLFHDAGATSAAEWAKSAAQATADGAAVGEGEFWDRFDATMPIKRRKIFIVKVRRDAGAPVVCSHMVCQNSDGPVPWLTRERLLCAEQHRPDGQRALRVLRLNLTGRRVCVQLLRQVFVGLDFMHAGGRLHQSLGPASVLLSTTEERDAASLRARLTDLAFSADVSDEALVGGATIGDLWDRGGVGGGGGPSKYAPPRPPPPCPTPLGS